MSTRKKKSCLILFLIADLQFQWSRSKVALPRSARATTITSCTCPWPRSGSSNQHHWRCSRAGTQHAWRAQRWTSLPVSSRRPPSDPATGDNCVDTWVKTHWLCSLPWIRLIATTAAFWIYEFPAAALSIWFWYRVQWSRGLSCLVLCSAYKGGDVATWWRPELGFEPATFPVPKLIQS